jgi:glycosyltransferase involved in cell wall biosynthesis
VRVLYVTQDFPEDGRTGGLIAAFYSVAQLAQAGHRVTVLALLADDSTTLPPPGLTSIAEVVAVRDVPKNSAARYAANLVDPLPWPVRKYASTRLGAEAARILRADAIDLVVFNSLHSATLLPLVRSLSDAPCVLLAHNVQSTIMGLYARFRRDALSRGYATLQWRKTLRFEARSLAAFDLVLAFSDVDARGLRALAPAASVEAVPLAIDARRLAAVSLPESLDVLLFAYFGWAPNVDSLNWFLDEVFPIVRRLRPATRVTVAGGGMPARLARRLAALEGVEFVGSPPNAADAYARARVVVVPLRIGSGVRVKIIEAMALGRAIVSTSKGCEGLDVTDRVHLVVADAPGEFAREVARLLDSPEERSTLGVNARRLAVERHDALGVDRPIVRKCEELVRIFRGIIP